MFDDRSRVLTFTDNTSKCLSDFVWGEILTIPSSKSRTNSQELFERTSFQRKDEPTIPQWSSEHQRRIHGDWPQANPVTDLRVDEARDHRNNTQDIDPNTASRRGHKKIGPGPNGLPDAPPDGYRTIHSKLEPGAVAKARSLLGGDWGTETPFEINGKRYMARVEPHCGPRGRKYGPVGWHKGVTLYEA
jgi:hypothetical protein